jgi:hypothetical protein
MFNLGEMDKNFTSELAIRGWFVAVFRHLQAKLAKDTLKYMLMAEPDKLPVALHMDKILFIGSTTKKIKHQFE